MTVDNDAGKGRPEAIKAVPVRHPGRWLGAAVILVLVAMFINFLLTSNALEWSEQWKYLYSDPVLKGVRNTVWLTLAAMVGGIVLGIVLALMRLSANPLLSGAAWVYLWFFRGTPLYTQLLIWGAIGTLFPTVGIGIPFGPEFETWKTQELVNAAIAASLGLILNEAAYMAEIVRAGILSVDEGQQEAASALGMSRMQTMRRIVLPQAMRVIVPPTGNESISMLKNTSLVAAVPYSELTFTAQTIYATTYKIIPMLVMACLWYLLISSVMMIGQYYLERHYSKGTSKGAEARQRLRFRAGGGAP
ncbi:MULTISPECIES: amino acid ABC transporter permease [Actinomadura]|uniref:Polar amino acid transport system permease protein n=1 Tax=Actinomadura madurae TaxID=1993 RepID=A0A1I5IX59_9ACTN|nr:amino acid ABC transporter permease [Actinomadura madurae]MCP9954147.1 amino acid ABC transporter permease [Actinomadura madurae]MCP9970896.1 amino acid ABC transporter permease [Actinomadura madurae]MCP9983372.1 amino acid ABC transporter permease [Actinomadura madurae]MCQ0005065.1 amino acid ABC transporter permease [Actinomadura madurae]MCQ0019623.1 amino acid ABC transporter permease [Actinomadura madurae]